ncbi:MAG: hypothetical protein AAFO77_01810, partial [Pseudomonadota bacterium]
MSILVALRRSLVGGEAPLKGVREDTQARIRAHQLATINQISKPALATNIVNAALVAGYFFYFSVPTLAIMVWAMTVVTFAGIGIYDVMRRSRRPRPDRASENGLKKAATNAAVLGVLWGVLPIISYGTTSIASDVLVTAVMAGMIGGGALALHPIPQAMRNYVIMMCAGSCIGLLKAGSDG